jgi:hypothetical protein
LEKSVQRPGDRILGPKDQNTGNRWHAQPNPDEDVTAEEERIAEEVKAFRRTH